MFQSLCFLAVFIMPNASVLLVGQTDAVSPLANQSQDAESANEMPEMLEQVAGLAGLTFILVMFTSAIMCGQWAINSGRNFWLWYLFGLFTGPLAGGCMLHRTAIDKVGDQAVNNPLGALLGIGIPAGGWFTWIYLLQRAFEN